jgi:hypothetical protein
MNVHFTIPFYLNDPHGSFGKAPHIVSKQHPYSKLALFPLHVKRNASDSDVPYNFNRIKRSRNKPIVIETEYLS